MDFTGQAIKLNDGDIAQAATDLGIEPAALHAVLSVETGGSGFDKVGRPKALFERHYFYRFLQSDPAKQQTAVDAGLAYPKWGEKPYPKGSDAVYAEISSACDIDLEAALKATSWGLGQIMGSNFQIAGCNSVQEMVKQAKESEANQLKQMCSFIKKNGLVDELQNKDWAGFAKRYNGPSYAQNQYDVKLASAYDKYA